MLFNSYIFILLFLPLTLIGYYILNHFSKYRLASIYLLLMSLWFYAYFNIKYLPIILTSIILNYLFYIFFNHNNVKWLRKVVLVVAVLLNVSLLLYFKYYDFFIENVNAVFDTEFTLKRLLLPLGISFFTFQQLSFVIDSYRNEIPKYDFINYALFVTYFPQLIAGPIVTHDEMVPQFLDEKKRKIDFQNLASGLYVFAMGFAKKVLIADVFGNAVNWGYANTDLLNATDAIVIMLSYTIQIYFDFSGYCDMATGIAKMMNFDLPQNFNSPYKSFTITEFWKRWHRTLTRFFTKYIYIPLGGNRKGETRMLLNTLIVFLVSGFWHGASWNFVLWGFLHGAFCVITKLFDKFFEKLHPALNWIITFLFVNLTWILFRATSISEAAGIIAKIGAMNFGGINYNILSVFKLDGVEALSTIFFGKGLLEINSGIYLLLFSVAAFAIFLGCKNVNEKLAEFRPTAAKSLFTVVLLVWGLISLSGMSTFLYFNF